MLPSHWFTYGKNSAYDDGVRAMRSGDFEAAINLFLKAQKDRTEPSIAKLSETLIVQCCRKQSAIHIEQGNGDLALETIEVALNFRNNFADLHYTKARAFFLIGDIERTKTSLGEAIALNPNYTAAIQLRGVVSEESESEMDAEILEFIRGELNSGNRAVALTAFDKATFTSEVDIRQRVVAAQTLSESSNWEPAATAWQEIIDDRPNYPDVRCQFGQALLELNRVEEAAAQFEQAIAINPNMADAYALLGIARKRLGLDREAKEAFEAARKLNPHHPIATMESASR